MEYKREELFNLAQRKIAVELSNRNQEKEFIRICRLCGEDVVRKDSTAYIKMNDGIKPIFPIYYAFQRAGEHCISWWTVKQSTVEDEGCSRISFETFKKKMEAKDEKEI